MKKLVAGVALLMVLAFGANAQVDKSDGKKFHKGKHNKEAVYQKLNLSDEQKQQMAATQTEFRTKMTELKKNENITVKEQKEKRMAIAKEHRATVDKILTSEQKTKMKEMRKESAGRKKGDARKKMEVMKKELNITDAQSARLKEVNENFRSKMSNVRKNSALNDEARKEQISALRKQQKEEVNSILTPEQQSKLKELRSSHSGRNRTR